MSKTLLRTFFKLLFLENCVMPRAFREHFPFYQVVLWCSFFFLLRTWHVKRVTIIESSSNTRQCDPLGGPLFALAHYQAFLETMVQAPTCVFPSLANDTHIIRPLNEITHVFDHISTQLTLVGLRVKVSKRNL
jgi:hypothetical protein